MRGEKQIARGWLWAIIPLILSISLLASACAPPIEATELASGADTSSPTPTATPTLLFHEVQPGETLWGIAQQYGIDLETLIQVNELENPDLIRPGQRLLISDQVTISGRPLPTPTPTPLRCVEGCQEQLPGCEIKGIIARLDGTRLYLLPEDALYPLRSADVWFCREEDAQRAGWRRWTPYGPAQP